jgi:hypothetical protein
MLLTAGMLNLAVLPTVRAAEPTREKMHSDTVSPATIVTDFFLVRPVALAALITAVPVATVVVPAAALFGNGRVVAREILGKPFHHTFRRHLGDFDEE